MTPRFRLLQARTSDDPVRHEERVAFADKLGVPVEALLPLDLLTEPVSYSAVTRGVDAVLVGGSGRFSIYDDAPWLRPFIHVLGELAARQFPTFASCFGFQGLVVALGGEVRADPQGAEVGSHTVQLTAEAASDPLFSRLPTRFVAQEGHKDRAMDLPSSAVWLARSERCPYQALRVGETVYATQFHPELTGDENRQRFLRYFHEYESALGEEAAEALLQAFRPSPDTPLLLRGFCELIAT